jgi:DHA1 family bicyclomycin/chloramphenicol resistance-like MFS transporter
MKTLIFHKQFRNLPMPSQSSQPSIARLAIILGILSAFGPLSIDMYLPGLPTIAQDFGVDTAAAQQTLSSFFVGLAVGQLIYGPISDRLGRRRPLLFGCALFTLACLGCFLAPSLNSLILLRFVMAFGACAGMVITRSVVRDLFDQRESARMYSMLVLVMGLAPMLAPLAGGQLLIYWGWRSIFLVLSAFGILCLVLVYFGLAESLVVERRVRQGPGAVLRSYGRLLCDGRFMGYTAAGGLASAAMFAYISGSPFVFIELNGVPPERYGLLFGVNALGLIAASQLNRWLLERYAGSQILVTALGVTAVSGLLLVVAAATGLGGFPGMLVVLFICIASTGLVGPNATAAAMAPYARQAGSASAMLGAIQFGFGAAAGVLVGLLFNGTALPMAATIALCGVSAFVMLRVLALRPQVSTQS